MTSGAKVVETSLTTIDNSPSPVRSDYAVKIQIFVWKNLSKVKQLHYSNGYHKIIEEIRFALCKSSLASGTETDTVFRKFMIKFGYKACCHWLKERKKKNETNKPRKRLWPAQKGKRQSLKWANELPRDFIDDVKSQCLATGLSKLKRFFSV